VRTLERFRSQKRTVLTPLAATQYSFEGGGIGGEGSQPVFAK
jgi:hypothetical protein